MNWQSWESSLFELLPSHWFFDLHHTLHLLADLVGKLHTLLLRNDDRMASGAAAGDLYTLELSVKNRKCFFLVHSKYYNF